MRIIKCILLFLIFTGINSAIAQDFLHSLAKDYNYKHQQILNSNSPKTYISCQIIEQQRMFSNNLNEGAERFVFSFAIDKNKQVYYNDKNIECVSLFNDDWIIFLTQDHLIKGNIKDYNKIRHNKINRKTGVYESYYLEGWTPPNRSKPIVIEGKGVGTCSTSSTNKF